MKLNNSKAGMLSGILFTACLFFSYVPSFAQEMENVNAKEEDAFYEWDADDNELWDAEEYGTATAEYGYLEEWDSDDDGLYTEDEINEGIFNAYDRDEDDLLSEDEFIDWNTAWGAGNDFDKLDLNDDDVLDYEEYGPGNVRLIEDWDTDDDDIFSGEEISGGLFEDLDLNKDNNLEYGEYNARIFNNWPED